MNNFGPSNPGPAPRAIVSRRIVRDLLLRWLATFVLLCAGPPALAQDWTYTTRPGDNIWNLTETHLTSIRYWKRLQAYNRIEDPYRILPGTRLKIPIRWLKVQPTSARIVVAEGNVERLDSVAARWVPAMAEDSLSSGDGVRTGAESSATVEFADRSRLLLQSGTEIMLDSMSAYGTTGMVDTRMRLQRGRVENEVVPASGEASRYHIITPSAVVAVRGTSFRSAFDDATGIALGEVTEGALAVSGERGRARRVPAGFGIRVAWGEAAEAPVELLPAPDLSALDGRAERLLVALEWPEVDGAVGYRVQLYPAGDAARLIGDVRVDAARVELDAPPDGDYRLRIRAIDERGLEGGNAEHALTVDARPAPPALVQPGADAPLHGAPPELWWSLPEGVARFHLQVAAEPDFAHLLVDLPGVEGSRHTLAEEPAPGVYHWRIASVSVDAERGPFSDPRSFRVLAVPAATTASGSVEEGRAVVSWGRAANAAGYEFQLARDESFEDLVVNETLSDTQYELAQPEAGTYYFRARGVSGEGVAGPYSPVNRLEVPGEPLSPAWLLLLAPLLLL